ncbi:heparinase II/III family protein [Clostridium sp. CX1]|uniref:alginate lyase family protein n=1 Tax=Clostridium sp. CX1 TaxID=2978346 RepID=UPI0021C000CC|nr:alginate lyase family protein [Clostridium sp. CX1]MCT8975971.1 heparinase II/III family protein [Clostridium sp. CX1]
MSDLYNKILKVKTMPIDLILNKIFDKLWKSVYYRYRKLKITIKPISINSIYFSNFRTSCAFFYEVKDKEFLKSKIETLSLKSETIEDADRICKHIFNVLGSGEIKLGDKIPWNEDFKTGFKWKNKFYKDIKIVNLDNYADVKVPWEISRFQHLFTLGKAYWLTDNEKYAIEFKDEIEDWIHNNPVEMSVNWTCAMDVAIRAVNWITGYHFFKDSKSIHNSFWIKFNRSLYLHGRHIMTNLEKGKFDKLANNHYLSDLIGVVWIGLYFKNLTIEDTKLKNNPKTWLEFGLKELENEMFIQVNEDGTDFEASTSYHRLVTELFLITTILCNKNNIKFSESYNKRLEKMCEFLMDITKPNGLSPLIGDADDGRLLILSSYFFWIKREFTHILAIAGEYFKRDDFRCLGSKYKQDALWICGNYVNLSSIGVTFKSKSYEQGGFYILRNNRIFCIIRCGELSCRGQGGHSHNDQLSFELNVDGYDFIIDPGTYVYTADYKMRNLYRSTKYHNTLWIQGYEQNNFYEKILFEMPEQSFGKCIEFNNETFKGKHFGYKNKCDIVHERHMHLNENKIEIEDILYGKRLEDNYKLSFVLDSDVKVEQKQGGLELIKNGKKVYIILDNEYIIEDSYISYGYGQILKTKKILVDIDDMKSKVYIAFS